MVCFRYSCRHIVRHLICHMTTTLAPLRRLRHDRPARWRAVICVQLQPSTRNTNIENSCERQLCITIARYVGVHDDTLSPLTPQRQACTDRLCDALVQTQGTTTTSSEGFQLAKGFEDGASSKPEARQQSPRLSRELRG